MCLTRGPNRQKLSFREVWTVPMVYVRYLVSEMNSKVDVRCLSYPASALFDVTTEGLRNGTVLQRLVNIGSLPSSTKKDA
jgi:hypothetical protein